MRRLLPLLLATPAWADSCTSFNALQFNPFELQRCISQMQALQQMNQTTTHIEIQNAETLTCLLAGALARSQPEPNTEIDDFMKKYCPLPRRPAPRK
jgi:hypothetical protein